MLVERQSEAVEALVALAATTRSLLCCYTRELDPGLLDAPPVLEALRTLAVRQRGVEIRILMQDLETPQHAGSVTRRSWKLVGRRWASGIRAEPAC